MDGVNKLIRFILDEFPKLTTEYVLEYKRCKMPDATMINRIYIHKADDLANQVCPCLALDDYDSFDEQEVLEDLKELINELPERFEEAVEIDIDLDDDSSLLELVPSKQDLLDKCYCRIVKTDTHKEFLDGIAKKAFLDLTYYFVIEHSTDEYSMSYIVKENMLDILKMSVDELFDIAYNNSINRSMLIKKNLSEHIKEIKSKIGKDVSMPEPELPELNVNTLIVTNEDNDYASFLIFDENIMNEVCDTLGTDELLIIPSSVHDFLIDDMHQIDDVEYSNAVVKHVNKSMPPHYVLSDHCYTFNKLYQEFNIV